MSLCPHCVQGVLHKGKPEGVWQDIGGVPCYVATPKGKHHHNKVLLFLSDVFGPQLINARLLADKFARAGFRTIIPDYFNGDPIPPDGLDEGSTFDFPAWLARHGSDVTRPLLDKAIAGLQKHGVKKFAATGYCFGGRYSFDLAIDNVTSTTVVSHPSLLENPIDLEKYAANSRAPLLINSCEIDPAFGIEFQAKADEILGNGRFKPGYKRTFWEGCTHGFAVRGDFSDPKVKAGYEGAFKAAVDWLREEFDGKEVESKL